MECTVLRCIDISLISIPYPNDESLKRQWDAPCSSSNFKFISTELYLTHENIVNPFMAALKPGALFRRAVQDNNGLQCIGAVNAFSALLARRAGVKSLYLSGSGVATASYGLPDLGITNLTDVCIDIERITTRVPDIPLLVDIDTGFGNALSIQRTVAGLISSAQKSKSVHLLLTYDLIQY